ncbi:MAG: restriction endonuclease [Anaerolineae bacterium]|nr:restriction endonuclease [Anaerolineae bacterium]
MNTGERAPIRLEEYQATRLPRATLSNDEGVLLWQTYGQYVAVEFPSPKTEQQWELMPQGWVGYIPLAADRVLALAPKVALGNLFGMLEYAYRLSSLKFLPDLVQTQSLAEFYESLADILAKRVLDRARKGFYRAYLERAAPLPYLTGRLDTQQMLQRPWDNQLHCEYQEHTADIEENQLLAWTLRRILHSGLCTRTLPTLRRAYHTLAGFATLTPFTPQACVGRLYNRLNDDYQPLHALCRFFLEHSGPGHQIGDHTFLPFLVNMARLYELFIAEWLKQHLPAQFRVQAQEHVAIGAGQDLHFNIDLTLSDTETGKTLCVMDTKYKTPDKPATSDIFQIVAYAEVKRCHEALLIYPQQVAFDERLGDIRVRSLTFATASDLEDAGQHFLTQLLSLFPQYN